MNNEIFDQSSLILIKVLRKDARILDANDAACAFYGYPRSELKQKSFNDLIVGQGGCEQGSPRQVHCTAGAVQKPVQLHLFPVDSGPGSDYLLYVVEDLTDIENRSFYLSLVNSLPLCIYRVDLEGKLTFVNKELQSQLQLPNQQLLGKTAYDLYPDELAEKYRQDDANVIESEQMLHEVEKNINPATQSHDYVEVIKAPVWDDQGNVVGVQGAFWNVTDRIEQEHNLKQAAAVFTYAKEAVLIANQDGYITDVNNAFSVITGYSKADIVNQIPRFLISSKNIKKLFKDVLVFTRAHGFWHGELQLHHKFQSQSISVQCSISAVTSDKGEITSYVILLTDITKQKEYQKQLELIALYDPLTRLPNRLHLSEKLNRAMKQARESQCRLAVLYIDLDGFKEVNDRNGHHVGDQLLVDISGKMQSILGKQDTVARLGGDEFVVVLPDYDNREDKNVLLSNLLQSISMPIHSATGVIEVSGSLGMTFYPQAESVDADHLIRQADVAMYQAKMQGKNRYAVFDVQKEQEQKSSQMLMVQLHSALVGDEFRVVYQPKVNMVNGAVVGVEALLRWQHPSQGLLAPEEFMSAVAEGNLVVAIDHWVIEHVVGQLQDWRRIGLDFNLSINVSIKTLEEPDFSHWLASLLLKYPGVDASKIILEVLESSAVEDVDQISLVIRASKQLGVSFSLDDFGTGYSTLNFLKKLPADELKIDRTFVRDMLHDEDDLAIIKGVLGLALAFDKKVVAEGVESEEHGLALLELGCEQAQGYVIAKPMSAQDLVLWVRSWQPFKSWTAYSSHEQEHAVLDNH